MIEKYLDDLESRIDSSSEDTLLAEWKCFCDGSLDADVFIPQRDKKIPPKIEWPDISINSALDDYELMAIHQLHKCSDAIANGTGELLNTFDGGAIHFCGKGDHYIRIMSQMEKLYAIHMSQPEYNDMEIIFNNTVDKNIRIIGLKGETANKAIENGRDLKKSVHCW